MNGQHFPGGISVKRPWRNCTVARMCRRDCQTEKDHTIRQCSGNRSFYTT